MKRVFLPLLVPFLLVGTWAHPASGDWFTYTEADGLAGNDAAQVVVDSTGTLWFGGGAGVTRYDGAAWQIVYDPYDGSTIQTMAMIVDHAGNVWLGTYYDGAYRYDGTSWRRYTTADGLNGSYVTAIKEDQSGTLWFGTDKGLCSFDGSAWRTYQLPPDYWEDYWVNDLETDLTGNLWVAMRTGALYRFDGVSFFPYPQLYSTWPDIMRDSKGTLWFASWGKVRQLDGARWTEYGAADGIPQVSVSGIAEDRSGNLWFGTSGSGVIRYDGERWETYTTADGLVYNAVRAIAQDRSGNLWFGTYEGVSRYDGARSRIYTTADGLAANFVTAMLQDREGYFWFGTEFGVSWYDGTNWRTFTTSDGLGSDIVTAIIQDRVGNLWFATADSGVSRYDGAGWRTYKTTDGLANDQVTCMAEDRRGNLWFGTYEGGVSRFDGVNWRTFTTVDGLAGMEVEAILEDHTGDIWVACWSGLSRFDGAVWHTYTVNDFPWAEGVEAIFEDSSGHLWLGTAGAGVAEYDGTQWRTFTKDDGLLDNYTLAFEEDLSGNLWFVNKNGVSRYSRGVFGAYSSLGGTSGFLVDDVLADRSGALWFASTDGLVRHEPDLVAPETVIWPSVPSLSTSTAHTIRFMAGYGEFKGVSFSYSFDGGPWSTWSSTNFWVGSGLGDGVHVFKVRARDQIGNVDTTVAAAVFEIDATPPSTMIASPVSGQAIRDSFVVSGAAWDARFKKYRLETRQAGTSTWDLLSESFIPVSEGPLYGWNTLSWGDGVYELRLSVTDTLGLTGNYAVRVVVDNRAPWAYETAPAEVKAASGGDVYTTGSEVHLYFPPRAFGEDAEVRIDSVSGSGVPDTLADGAHSVGAGYEISWGGVPLEKAGTLEMKLASEKPVPALYVFGADSTWHRLGGTVEEQVGGASESEARISAAITQPGRYALFLEPAGTGAAGANTLSALSLTPRVFSPNGTFANDHVAIGFTLGRSAPVTVKVYNRAGRLVRELVSGEVMGAGANLVRWNGRDGDANPASDGLYLIVVDALGQKQSKTIAVVR